MKPSWYFVLVGAEGCSEIDKEDWIREPTEEEAAEWFKENNVATIDHTGRPYFLRAVSANKAPQEAVDRAKNYMRVKRLIS